MFKLRSLRTLVAASAAALALAACGGGDGSSDSEGGPKGEAVSGGTLTLISNAEPRGLDPAVMQSAWAFNPAEGDALYGALIHIDSVTGEVTPKMAESWETTDNGKTFTLKLREGLKFTDGTPLDAEAVKYNWDRLKDPTISPTHAGVAALVQSTEAVDATTLKVTMLSPTPQYSSGVATSSLNWIASPKALEAGPEAFNANPIGAGPFKLVKWTPNDVIELEKNEDYYEGPEKPYLDKLLVRTVVDTNQRYNTLMSDGADLILDNNPVTVKKLEDAGKQVDSFQLGGGNFLTLNSKKPPFDDIRARQAVAAAVDLDQINEVLYQGLGVVTHTLFAEGAPLYSDKPLDGYDPEKAKELFDELAADGKPVEFTFTSFGSFETNTLGENLITQLSQYDNVKVDMKTIELAQTGPVLVGGDYDMIVLGTNFSGDPDPRVWLGYHSLSPIGAFVSSPEMDAALDAGRAAATLEERKAAYDKVQDLLIEQRPVIFYNTAEPSMIANDNVGGLAQQSWGTPIVDGLWIAD
ncbi:ABC transporter substrate-binding protein [Nocardioides sp. cx-173]|uniref:ABC transporter substrate-binding protein n=1 Tax=Nocardioides sp. cx-173 TaxID=2898796 RepID=UPI001E4F993D|nr:ABC transporter substrate-binding protein [Nocardioides sp. cx-173]MCD4524255.1 ABC transporter substrate-binding protein [Nocardioides sp. cx-173]UGB41647.1 ABC transporter substrate-binding protein [Nocardioides sp. cx-173]